MKKIFCTKKLVSCVLALVMAFPSVSLVKANALLWSNEGPPNQTAGQLAIENVKVVTDGALQIPVTFDGTNDWDRNKYELSFYTNDLLLKPKGEIKFMLGIPEGSFDGILKYTAALKQGDLWNWESSGVYGDLTDAHFQNQTPDAEGIRYVPISITLPEGFATVKAVVIQLSSYESSYAGNIYIKQLQMLDGENQDPVDPTPEVGDILWKFDQNTEDWNYGGSWDYHGSDPIVMHSDVNGGSLSISADFTNDTNSTWSEIKLNNYIKNKGSFQLEGYDTLSFDFIYDPAAYTTGSFQAKLFMKNDDGTSIDKYNPLRLENVIDLENGLKKGTATISFTTKKLTIDSITLSIISTSTDYKGTLYLDNICLSKGGSTNDYTTKTVTPLEKSPISLGTLAIPNTVTLVDPQASPNTANVYAYLLGIGETDNVLYGHQNDNTSKVGDFEGDSDSDTKDITGQYPAIFGIDTLAFTGTELAPTPGKTAVETAAALGIQAHDAGGILTLSCHMPNFADVASKPRIQGQYDFSGYTPNNVTGDVVTRILPGGDLNEVYIAYLDLIAQYADILATEDIPVLFRPFHENNGSWFWWGAAYCTPSQYKNLFRYTVEYLRDTKDVHNFLYMYSPNGPFNSTDDYLTRYPGDAFVDVMAFDLYHDNPTETDQWMASFKKTMDIVQEIAEARGKLCTVSETGMRVMDSLNDGEHHDGLAIHGNRRKDWFSEVLNAVAPTKMAYFMVWANFNTSNFSAPFMVSPTQGQDMINNFIQFYNDPKAIFANSSALYTQLNTQVLPAGSYGYITSVQTYERIVAEKQLIAEVSGITDHTTASFVLLNDKGTVLKTITAVIGQDAKKATALLSQLELISLGQTIGSIQLVLNDVVVDDVPVLFNMPKTAPPVELVDDFESYYGENELLHSAWQTNVGPGCSVSYQLSPTEKSQGNFGLDVHYHISTEFTNEGWAGIVQNRNVDWSAYDALQLWIHPDGLGQKLVIQLRSNGEDFEVFLNNITATTTPTLVTLPFRDFVGKNRGTFDPTRIEAFGIYFNTLEPSGAATPWNVDSHVYFDDIHAVNTKVAQIGFDFQDGYTAPVVKTLEKGTAFSFPSIPVRSGYEFVGWFTEVDGKGISFTTSTMVSSDITLYGYWKKTTEEKKSSSSSHSSGGGSSIVVLPQQQTATNTPPEKSETTLVIKTKSVYFKDVTGPFSTAIDALYEKKMIQGIGNHQFAPKANLKRGDLLILIFKSLGIETIETTTSFQDVQPSDYFYSYVATSKAMGLVYGDGVHYSPKDTVSVEDALTILYRALQKTNQLPKIAKQATTKKYTNVADYAQTAYAFFVDAQLITDSLSPKDGMTREQMAEILYRWMLSKTNS